MDTAFFTLLLQDANEMNQLKHRAGDQLVSLQYKQTAQVLNLQSCDNISLILLSKRLLVGKKILKSLRVWKRGFDNSLLKEPRHAARQGSTLSIFFPHVLTTGLSNNKQNIYSQQILFFQSQQIFTYAQNYLVFSMTPSQWAIFSTNLRKDN